MEKLKKIIKDFGIFVLVFCIFLVLLLYKQFNPSDYKYVSPKEVTSMVESGKDFILVLGQTEYDEEEDEGKTDYRSQTIEQNQFVVQYIQDKDQKVYFLDEKDIEDLPAYLKETFQTESEVLPQTYFVKDGKVTNYKEGTVKYYDFSKYVSEWKSK